MKNTKNIIYYGLAIILLITGLLLFSYSRQQTILANCNIINGQTSNSFTCLGECQVYGEALCSSCSGSSIVIFRTNAKTLSDYDLSSAWIALNCIPSGSSCIKSDNLNSYCYSSSTGGTDDNYVITSPLQNRIYVYNSNLYIETPKGLRKYIKCSSAETSINSIESYKRNDQELYGGLGNVCKCSTDVKIDNKIIDIAEYEDITSGTYKTKTYALTKNSIFSFPGTIKYSIFDSSKSCIVDTCNELKTGFYPCITQDECKVKSEKLTSCSDGQYCVDGISGAKCVDPFEVFGEFNKNTYGINEEISFNILINSNSLANAYATFYLIDFNGNKQLLTSKTIYFPNADKFNIKIPGKSDTGDYTLKVDINYGGKITSREYIFKISNPITIGAIKAYSELTGTAIFTGQPIIIELRTYQSGIEIDAETSVVAKLTKVNGQVTNLQIPNRIKSSTGVYRYPILSSEEGTLLITATASRLGYITTLTQEFNIKLAEIKQEFKNINSLQGVKPGSYEIKFATKNPSNEMISVINNIKMLTPAGTYDLIGNIQGSNGEYSFIYNFKSDGGYKVYLHSEALGYGSKDIQSEFINIIKEGDIVAECLENKDCAVGEVCSNRKCSKKSSNLLYIILAIILIIVIIVLIILLIKRKPQQVIR